MNKEIKKETASKGISDEKEEWMKEVGMKKFEHPMEYYLGMDKVFSEKYIRETPLEVLKAMHLTRD